MSRYINAEWLLNFFEPYPDDYQTPLGILRACVDDAPSIDIVRCKECEYWNPWHCSQFNDHTHEVDYCSYGERKETDHE